MNTFVKVPQIAFAILVCIVFNSCTKDTDLVSGYIINTAKQKKEVSIIYVDVKVKLPEVDIKIDVFSKQVFPRWEQIKIREKSKLVDKVVVFKE